MILRYLTDLDFKLISFIYLSIQILLWDIRCPTSPCAIFRFVAPETTTTTNSNPLLRSGGGMVMSLFFGSSSSSSQNQTDGNNEHLLFGGYEDGSIGWFDMRTTT